MHHLPPSRMGSSQYMSQPSPGVRPGPPGILQRKTTEQSVAVSAQPNATGHNEFENSTGALGSESGTSKQSKAEVSNKDHRRDAEPLDGGD